MREAVAAGRQQHCEIIMIRRGRVVLRTNMATEARGREEQWRRFTADWRCQQSVITVTAAVVGLLQMSSVLTFLKQCFEELLHIQMIDFLSKCLVQIFVRCPGENPHYQL